MGTDLNGNPLPKGITQRKNGVYRGRFNYKNESYTLDSRNLNELIHQLENLRFEVKHGIKNNNFDEGITLSAWFNVWLNTHKRKSVKESTAFRYDDFYNRYIDPKLGQYKLVEFKPVIIERFLQDMADNDYATKTIRDVYNILHGVLKYAVRNRLILYDPCEGVELPKTRRKDIRVLSVDEQKEVLFHASGRQYENLIKVALGTGMRGGELLGLTWDNVSFENREIQVRKTLVHIKERNSSKYVFKFQTPKTPKSVRNIPMQESVYLALQEQKKQLKKMKKAQGKSWKTLKGFDNLVFLGKNGRPVTIHCFQAALISIEKAINKSRKQFAAGSGTEYVPIPHFYPHALRHTFATRCFEAGIDAKVVQTFLGHSSISITLDLYTHVSDDKGKLEMQKLENLYQEF